MKLVNCDKKYWEFVRLLRMDQNNISGFVQKNYISKIDQIKYMEINSNNYRIALIDEVPVGYVGVINQDIRICTHSSYKAKGVGKFMLNESMKIWKDSTAKVKKINIISTKLFIKCGFNIYNEDEEFIYFNKKIK